jgi:hypothetical protein
MIVLMLVITLMIGCYHVLLKYISSRLGPFLCLRSVSGFTYVCRRFFLKLKIGYYCICMAGSADVGADYAVKFVVRKDTTILARPQSDDELKATSLALPTPVIRSLFHPWGQKFGLCLWH